MKMTGALSQHAALVGRAVFCYLDTVGRGCLARKSLLHERFCPARLGSLNLQQSNELDSGKRLGNS
jgi:hypothetical protein